MFRCLLYHHDGDFYDCVPIDIFPWSWQADNTEKMDWIADYWDYLSEDGRTFNWWDIDVDEDVNNYYTPKVYRS